MASPSPNHRVPGDIPGILQDRLASDRAPRVPARALPDLHRTLKPSLETRMSARFSLAYRPSGSAAISGPRILYRFARAVGQRPGRGAPRKLVARLHPHPVLGGAPADILQRERHVRGHTRLPVQQARQRSTLAAEPSRRIGHVPAHLLHALADQLTQMRRVRIGPTRSFAMSFMVSNPIGQWSSIRSTSTCSPSSKWSTTRRLPETRTLHWPARSPLRGCSRKPGPGASALLGSRVQRTGTTSVRGKSPPLNSRDSPVWRASAYAQQSPRFRPAG